ncbi:MAG: hypothetical protein IPH13_18305 [Planctomycetes bacterium]|nr:hypothetical protein [Planctomycetota bacterium]
MIARLIRFWLRVQWLMVIGPVIGLTIAIGANDSMEFWTDPDDESLAAVQFIWLGIACVLGLVVHGFDQIPAFREYVLHRGVRPSGLFVGRFVAGLVVTVVIAAVPIGIGSWFASFGDSGALVTADGVLRWLAVGSSALAGYSFGAWATTLRGPVWSVASIAMFATGALVGLELMLVLATPQTPAPSGLRYVMFQVGAALVYAFIAVRGHLRHNDPDRPVPWPMQWTRAVAIAASFAVLACFATPPVQHAIAGLVHQYPSIVKRADGAFELALVDRERGRLRRVTPDHRQTGDDRGREATDEIVFAPARFRLDAPATAEADLPPLSHTRREFRLGSAVHQLMFHPFEQVWIEQPSGKLVFARRGLLSWIDDRATRIESLRVELPRPDGRGFGERTTVLAAGTAVGFDDFRGEHSSFVLGDLDDGTLWRAVHRGEPRRVEAITFPRGDRFRSWAWSRGATGVTNANATPYEWSRALDGDLGAVVVLGEQGRYAFDEHGALVPTEAEPLAWRSADDSRVRVLPGADPFFARVDVLAADGSVEFSHDYAPYRRGAITARAVAIGWGLLRPAALARIDVPGIDGAETTLAFARPIFGVAFALVLAGVTWLALRRRGAELARCVGWAMIVAVFGPVGFLTFLMLESKAAFARIPTTSVVERRTPTVLEGIAPAA